MKTRTAELRERHSRMLRWSLGVAVLLHFGAFYFIAWQRTERAATPRALTTVGAAQWTGTPVDIFFGPPSIFESDGTLSTEAPDRVLEAARAVRLPDECASARTGGPPGSGRVRLTVNERGLIDAVSLAESTGDPCWDVLVQQVAADLHYRWLPDERFPAPVELVQPLTVAWATN